MEAYIFDAIRTPRGNGKAGKSSLKDIKPVKLLSQLYAALEQRTGLSNTEIEAVILGCVGQVGGQGANIAKVSAYKVFLENAKMTTNVFFLFFLIFYGS